ncbi:MAG: pyruvate dehydrogenase (acetyl-transferring) E1 component subunit alpha [Legionella sp.]
MSTIVARFEISYTQILDNHGNLSSSLPEFAKNTEILLHLYRTMVHARLFDKKAIVLQRTGKIGTYAPTHGQEAIATAIGYAMQKQDVFIPYYRDNAAQFQRGVKPSEILAYWGGDERGNQFSNNAEDLPICVPIASQCLHAAGIAHAFNYKKQPRVALVSIGEGGTSEGDFYEALNIAGVWNLPLVFVVNNNQWAISVPLSKQTRCKSIAQKAIAAGFDGVQVDGNDILATYEVISKAIHKARLGQGPTLIEALTYRLSDHTTADDASRYQPQHEVEQAKINEPINRFKKYLIQQNIWNEQLDESLIRNCNQEIQDEVDRYLTRPAQTINSIFDYHYQTIPDSLIEQRMIALEDLGDD